MKHSFGSKATGHKEIIYERALMNTDYSYNNIIDEFRDYDYNLDGSLYQESTSSEFYIMVMK